VAWPMSARERELRAWIRARRRSPTSGLLDYHHEPMTSLVDPVDRWQHRREAGRLLAAVRKTERWRRSVMEGLEARGWTRRG